jgi:hypothetical protein
MGAPHCWTCYLEDLVYNRTGALVVEGFNLRPGDKLLLIASDRCPPEMAQRILAKVEAHHPEIHVTMVAGMTGVQVHADQGQVL